MKTSRPLHVLELWLGVIMGMLSVKYFCSIKASFYVSQISRRSYDCHNVELNLATHSFWDITGFKRVVSVFAASFL